MKANWQFQLTEIHGGKPSTDRRYVDVKSNVVHSDDEVLLNLKNDKDSLIIKMSPQEAKALAKRLMGKS